MTEDCLANRPGYGRTFRIAMGVIGGLALIQIVALAFGVLRRAPEPVSSAATPATIVPTAPAATPTTLAAPAPFGEPVETAPEFPATVDGSLVGTAPVALAADVAAGSDAMNRLLPDFAAVESATDRAGGARRSPDTVPGGALASPASALGASAADSPSLSAALALAARENELSGEPILERLMVTGAELRASGNMQGALKAFREVETDLPNHPRVLAELAATLSQMGLTDKAGQYWERLEATGPVVAGAYFPLAGQQLRGEAPSVPSNAPLMKIAEVKVQEQAPTSEGQKVTLRVVVDAEPASRPVGDDLTVLVQFYDRISGGGIKLTTADISYEYPSAPYDWQSGGTEEIVVNYNQPVFSEEQQLELGERSYFGYAIELYYRDQIQDKVVMPEEIARLRLESSPATAPTGKFLGPENALFPDPVYP